MKNEKQKILIVDDASENIDILLELLKEDYKIAAAKSGDQALIMVRKNQPDLILLDILMPQMDGYEVCRRLKSEEGTKNIPIIFITAVSEAMDEAKAFSLGAVDYITKPFNPLTVRARVKTHMILKKRTDMLEQLVCLDGLTGIHNRRKFDEVLISEWKRMIREKRPLSLVILDIDYFKKYNDNFGHANGDECLRKVAGCLKKCIVRPADVLCRYGGEEFGVILPTTDVAGAFNVAEKMRHHVYQMNIPHKYSKIEDRITISAGVSSSSPSTLDSHLPITLLEETDRMLYEAKNSGRNRVASSELKK